MIRRVHVPEVRVGELDLPESQAHHLRDVLRLKLEDEVELFDSTARTARAVICDISSNAVTVRIAEVITTSPADSLTIASALPKGDRADWMIEKLSELGVSRFVPLQTQRSVVHPEGRSKFERWSRIAAEAAKQSRRAGVMRIDLLMPLVSCLESSCAQRLYLSPAAAKPLLTQIRREGDVTLLIGPEGGWTDDELQLFAARNVQPAQLTESILRIETAAVAAAAIAQCAISNLRSQI